MNEVLRLKRDRLSTSLFSVLATMIVVGGLAVSSATGDDNPRPPVPPPPALCELYPIALDTRSLANAEPGDVIPDILNGTQPGNFGWLTWTGDHAVKTLARSLTPPGDSGRYVNPADPADHTVSVGDRVRGRPGAVNAKAVRRALDLLKTRDIIVPIWDETSAHQGKHGGGGDGGGGEDDDDDDDGGSGGSNVTYRVSGFATVRLLDYRISGKARITVRFLGLDSCGPAQERPPVAVDGAAQTAEDTIKELELSASDPDGDPLSFAIVSGPAHGTLGPVQGAQVSYAPALDYHGPDSFTFKANDGALDSNVATFLLTITPVNDVPVCRDLSSVQTPFETPVETDPDCADVDGDALSFQISAQGTKGTASVVAGRLRYVPGAGETGADSFRYQARDGVVGSNEATVSVTIGPIPNRAPIARDDVLAQAEEATGSVNVLANDSDPDGDTLALDSWTQGQHGNVSCLPSGVCTYTPALDFHGEDSFGYRIDDGHGHSAEATVRVAVTPVNDRPIANDASAETAEDTATQLTLGAVDVDGDQLSFSMVTGPAHGSLSPLAGNLVTYTPAANYHGADSFTFRASDGTSDSNAATVSLTVTSVNDAPTCRDLTTLETPFETPVTADPDCSDVDGDSLGFEIAAQGAKGTASVVDGRLSYAPGAGQTGADSFRYRALDGAAGSNEATVTVTVAPPLPPPTAGASSQELIQADLDGGLIDYGTSLIYRAWTLFWDARLPARYDGTGSTGEDLSLFSEIEAALPSLSPDQKAELQGWIARPTDPLSPFGPATAATNQSRTAAADGSTAAATQTTAAPTADPPPPVKCTAPNSWLHVDYPDDNSDTGFRAWMCAASQDDADEILNDVLIQFDGISQLFTQPEPAGMGPPVPDTQSVPDNGGNGKIDVYLLDTNQCRDRNNRCEQIEGDALAQALPDGPIGKAPGFPAQSSSGYLMVSLRNKNDTPTLAHEFFHILQYAHTVGGVKGEFGNVYASWYSEASASWAEWHPTLRHLSKDDSEDDLYPRFRSFQENNLSLLEHSPTDHQYDSWIWPLFQELEGGGATAVYQTWASAESARSPASIDAAVDSRLPFAASFRDFSVRNLQPAEYVSLFNTGLESDTWRSRIFDFPKESHVVTSSRTIGLGPDLVAAGIDVLAAQNDRFKIMDPRIRQVTIDLSALQNVGSADLDIVGQIRLPAAETPPHRWRRIKANSSTYTLCRDFPDEDFDLFYVVVSNHASTRKANGGPDPTAAMTGAYTVETKDRCDVPIEYKGTFKMKQRFSGGPSLIDFDAEGNVTFKYRSTEAECGSLVPPTPTSLKHCYYLDSAQETWTAPQVSDEPSRPSPCNYFPRAAQFSYANDLGSHGGIQITIRHPEPSFSNIYDAWFGSSTKTMVVDTTDVDPEDPCGRGTFTIRLPFYSIVSSGCFNSPPPPPPRFTGWPLSGSCTFDDGHTATTWSWDLSPIFQP